MSLELDKQVVGNALEGKEKLDLYALKRLILTELAYNGVFQENKFCGFSKKEICDAVAHPERYGKRILKLSKYMYLKSGYYKRLVKYYSTMAKYYWTVDTEVRSLKFEETSNKTLKSGLYRFIDRVNRLRLEYELERIISTMMINDACFGYLVETEYDSFIFYLPAECCEITHVVNGVLGFSINVGFYTKNKQKILPEELRNLVANARKEGKTQVAIPYDKSVCFKYNNQFTYLYPPLFQLVSDILDIDDYKSLARAKTEQDCYRLIALRIPTTEDGQLALGDEVITPFVQMAKAIVPDTIGIVPVPMDTTAIQFNSDQAERDKVDDATTQLYSEAGVSQALMSGATSGSELSMSVKADAGDIFRIYRQIEKWVNFQMQVRGVAFTSNYSFNFSLLDITTFNEDEVVERELKLSQLSVPNKMKLAAASGINPAKLFGNTLVENSVLMLSEQWTVLKSSSTQSSDSNNETGRPSVDDDKLSESGENARENGSNIPENRI